jgi:hypothetical protein
MRHLPNLRNDLKTMLWVSTKAYTITFLFNSAMTFISFFNLSIKS